MVHFLSRRQNWAKASPLFGIASAVWLCMTFHPSQAIFWALVNIPLFLFHQTEEHLWPGGFKDYMNRVLYQLPAGEERLTDVRIFWINIMFVWFPFLIFGILSAYNLGFGLLIIIFSIMNASTHIEEAIRRKRWNPGLGMASVQMLASIYAAYFISTYGLADKAFWWAGAILFSAIVHIILYRFVMR